MHTQYVLLRLRKELVDVQYGDEHHFRRPIGTTPTRQSTVFFLTLSLRTAGAVRFELGARLVDGGGSRLDTRTVMTLLSTLSRYLSIESSEPLI